MERIHKDTRPLQTRRHRHRPYGYELGQHYDGGPLTSPHDLCHDAFGASDNYLNLKFYHGPLEGELGILEAASLFMKGTISIKALLFKPARPASRAIQSNSSNRTTANTFPMFVASTKEANDD